MTNQFLAGALAAALLALGAAPAAAAPEDDYVALMTAIEIDKSCLALKYIESSAARGAAFDYLMQTTQWAFVQSGRMSQEEYDAWEDALDQRARDAAAAAGCTDAALPAILAAKAKAAERLYQGLVLAFFFDGYQDSIYRRPLDDHEKGAASGYDAYLQQIYGESFQSFVAYNHEQARLKLPQAMLDASLAAQDGVDDFYDPFSIVILSLEDGQKASYAQSEARNAVNQVQFEVTAEANNYLVRPLVVLGDWVIPELRRPMETDGWPVVEGPGSMLLDATPEIADDSETSWQDLYWVAVLKPDRGLRIMFYGQTATTIGTPFVRLYAPNQAPAEGTYPWETFDAPGFRDTATGYDPVPVTEGCMGGPCFDFPPEVTDALLAHRDDNLAELYVATSADAANPFSFRQGRLSVGYLWKIVKGE